MGLLPLVKSSDTTLSLLQTKWKAALDPVLKNIFINGVLLKNIPLVNGATPVNHMLGQLQQGWFIVDQNAAAQIYRSKPFNSSTLILTSNAVVTVSLWVF